MCDLIVLKTDAEREAMDATGADMTWIGQNTDMDMDDQPDYVSRDRVQELVAAGKRLVCSIWKEDDVTYADFYILGGV